MSVHGFVYVCVCSNESIIIDTSRCDRWKDLAMDLTRKMFTIVHCLSINTQKWAEGFTKRITLHFDQQITWNLAFWLDNILICDTFCAILSIQHFGNSFDWQWEVMILVCEPYSVIFRERCHINRVKVAIFAHKHRENEQFTSFQFIYDIELPEIQCLI